MSRLPDRASHVFFLRRLAAEKQPGKGSGTLGDLLTAQVVKEYVRPATTGTKTNFVDCLRAGSLDKKVAVGLGWCPNGVLMEEPANPKAFGPTTYFASHAWSYRFKEFVSMLEGHYNSQPKTQGGTAYVPIYYWVDILAVTQHFSGDFKDHPDSDFPGVIRASQAVLFTMHPWRSPVAPTRVWCLFEALTAVQAKGVGFEVILDTGNSKDTNASTLLAIASGIDARAANATVASDKAYIMGCIKAGLGVDAFNTVLRDTLKAALAEVMMTKAMNENNNAAAIALVKVGACTGQNGVLDLPRYLPHASPAEVASVIDALAGGGGGAAPTPRGLVLAARTRGMQLTSRSSTWEDGAGKALGEMPHHRGPCPGSSSSTAAYDPNKGDRPVWTYMPPRGGVLAALGRLLAARQQQPAAAAVARSGGGGGGDAASSTAGGGGGGLVELWLSLGPPDAHDEEVASGGATHKTESGANASPAAAGSGSRTSLPRLPPASVRQLRGSGGAASASAPSSPMRGAAAAGAAGSRATAAATSGGAAGRGVVAGGGGGGGTGGGGGRVALWSGLRASGTLRMLCLHGCVLCPADVDGMAAALRGNSVLRVLQMWDFIPPPGSATGAAGAGGLIRGLLAAGLASRTLTHLHIVPSRVCWVPELPELPAAAAAAESALKELVLAPVALAPPAVRQLAEALAALPGLCGGAVDCLKPPPLTWLPAPTSEEFGQWWEVRTPVPKGSTHPPNHIQVMQVVEERRCSPSGVPMEAGAPADAVGDLKALFEVIGVGGSSGASSGGGSALSRGGGSAEAFLPPLLLQRASNSSAAAAFTTTAPGGGASSTGYTDADAAAGPWAPRTAAVAHFIGACAGLPAAQARGVTHSTSHTGGLYTVPVEEGLAAAAALRNYDAIMTAALKAAPPEYVSRIKRHELLPPRKDGFLLAKALHASQWD